MKTLSHLAWSVAAAGALLAHPLQAQTVDPPRLDASGTAGWFAGVRESQGPYYDNDTQHRWVFGGDAGVYWTEHLKSQVGVSGTTTGSSFVLVPIPPPHDRAYPYASGRLRIRDVRVVAQQLYQFGRNAWVHPYVGAGVVMRRETSRLSATPPGATRYDDGTWGEAERVAVLRQYVARLPVGGRVRVQTVDGTRFSATLLSADHERVVLQPRGRLTEPVRAIPLSSLQLIEPDSQNGTHYLVKAVAVGVATGAATFVTLMMIAFATID